MMNAKHWPNWAIASASVIGRSHLALGEVGCQDAHAVYTLDHGWRIAVVADGAGSYEDSGLGAQMVVKSAALHLRQLILKKGWHKRAVLPKYGTWRKHVLDIAYRLKDELRELANAKQIDFENLSCTLIALVASPIGAMLFHLGDGRAAVRDQHGDWHSLMRPYNVGPHQTIFLTSPWEDDESKFLRTNIFPEAIDSFVVATDGGAAAAFVIAAQTLDGKAIIDPNYPYPGFLDPNCDALKKQSLLDVAQDEINATWQNYLINGNQVLKWEPDDKTIILGAL
jgi:hypothetical protein